MGDGTSSDSRGGGSLRESVFQIPVPHGNELLPTLFHVIELFNPGLVLVCHPDCSVAGLVGLEAPVDRGPVTGALRVIETGISLSHEVRRTGFCAGILVEGAGNGCSPSSSEDARASESGVERRMPGWLFSNLADALFGGVWETDEGLLLDGAAMVFFKLTKEHNFEAMNTTGSV